LSLRLLLTTESLYIYEDRFSSPDWKDDIENTEWLDLLLPFTAVKNLYLSERFLPRIAPALQELTGGRTTEVLPALQNVLLEGLQPSEPHSVQEGIAQFISARQLTNRPVAISVWERHPDLRYLPLHAAEVGGDWLPLCFYRQNSLGHSKQICHRIR
jgi:hypothetical protein